MRNRDLPVPSDAAAARVNQAGERAMTPARPLPKLPRWSVVRLVLGFATLAALCAWLCLRYDSMLYVAALMGLLVGIEWWLSSHLRCPDCKHRLDPFAED